MVKRNISYITTAKGDHFPYRAAASFHDFNYVLNFRGAGHGVWKALIRILVVKLLDILACLSQNGFANSMPLEEPASFMKL
jgi:hypothetical protein